MIDDCNKLRELISHFTTAMLVTHDGISGMRARPMALVEVEDCCILWFISSKESSKTEEIKRDDRVSVICQKDQSTYLSIAGSARLVESRAQIESLWQEAFKIWFPRGKNDPNLILIRVEPIQAEYWDNSGINKVKYLLRAAEAYVTGTAMPTFVGSQHGAIGLSSAWFH